MHFLESAIKILFHTQNRRKFAVEIKIRQRAQAAPRQFEMKKLVLMAVAAMMATMSVNAQSDEQYLKHEIGVSYGTLSNSDWMSLGDAFGSITASFGQYTYNNGSFTGPIGLEYYYHINPVIGVGGVGVFASETKDIIMMNDKVGDAKNTYISVMHIYIILNNYIINSS